MPDYFRFPRQRLEIRGKLFQSAYGGRRRWETRMRIQPGGNENILILLSIIFATKQAIQLDRGSHTRATVTHVPRNMAIASLTSSFASAVLFSCTTTPPHR